MKGLSVILAAAFVMALTRSACAQAFFGGGVVAFNPEISTVSSGTVIDAQAVVSYDRKYVTLNMQAQQSSLLSLRTFQVAAAAQNVGPAMGFVGGVNPGGASPIVQPPSSSPDEIDRRAVAARSVLQKRGMFLLRAN